jgi:hypothetical protein
MAAELALTPREYRWDHRLHVLPERLRTVDAFAAMIAILVLGIMVELAWKRMHGRAASPAVHEAAPAKGT